MQTNPPSGRRFAPVWIAAFSLGRKAWASYALVVLAVVLADEALTWPLRLLMQGVPVYDDLSSAFLRDGLFLHRAASVAGYLGLYIALFTLLSGTVLCLALSSAQGKADSLGAVAEKIRRVWKPLFIITAERFGAMLALYMLIMTGLFGSLLGFVFFMAALIGFAGNALALPLALIEGIPHHFARLESRERMKGKRLNFYLNALPALLLLVVVMGCAASGSGWAGRLTLDVVWYAAFALLFLIDFVYYERQLPS